jgi:hypothetical protein
MLYTAPESPTLRSTGFPSQLANRSACSLAYDRRQRSIACSWATSRLIPGIPLMPPQRTVAAIPTTALVSVSAPAYSLHPKEMADNSPLATLNQNYESFRGEFLFRQESLAHGSPRSSNNNNRRHVSHLWLVGSLNFWAGEQAIREDCVLILRRIIRNSRGGHWRWDRA